MVTVVKYIGEYVEEQACVSLHSPLRVPSSSPSRVMILVPRAFHRGVGAPSECHYCLGKDYKRAGQWIYGHWLRYCSSTTWAAQRQCTRGKRCKQRPSRWPHSLTYFLRWTVKARRLDYQPVTAEGTAAALCKTTCLDHGKNKCLSCILPSERLTHTRTYTPTLLWSLLAGFLQVLLTVWLWAGCCTVTISLKDQFLALVTA